MAGKKKKKKKKAKAASQGEGLLRKPRGRPQWAILVSLVPHAVYEVGEVLWDLKDNPVVRRLASFFRLFRF